MLNYSLRNISADGLERYLYFQCFFFRRKFIICNFFPSSVYFVVLVLDYLSTQSSARLLKRHTMKNVEKLLNFPLEWIAFAFQTRCFFSEENKDDNKNRQCRLLKLFLLFLFVVGVCHANFFSPSHDPYRQSQISLFCALDCFFYLCTRWRQNNLRKNNEWMINIKIFLPRYRNSLAIIFYGSLSHSRTF